MQNPSTGHFSELGPSNSKILFTNQFSIPWRWKAETLILPHCTWGLVLHSSIFNLLDEIHFPTHFRVGRWNNRKRIYSDYVWSRGSTCVLYQNLALPYTFVPKSPLQKRCPTIYRYNCPVTVTQNNPKSDEIDSNGIFHCFLSNTAANSTNEVLRFDSTFKLTELGLFQITYLRYQEQKISA